MPELLDLTDDELQGLIRTNPYSPALKASAKEAVGKTYSPVRVTPEHIPTKPYEPEPVITEAFTDPSTYLDATPVQESAGRFVGATDPTGKLLDTTTEADLYADPHSIAEGFFAGFNKSSLGLMFKGGIPQERFQHPDKLPLGTEMGEMLGGIGGDMPFILAGSVIGGRGGPTTAAAGGMALPAVIRKLLVDGYSNGWEKDHIVNNILGALYEGGKAGAVGAVFAQGGPVVDKVLGKFGLSQAVMKPAQTAVVEATKKIMGIELMTYASGVLEGHLPDDKEFLKNALLVAGLEYGPEATMKLAEYYKNRGVSPERAALEALQDPTLREWLKTKEGEAPKKVQEERVYDPHSGEMYKESEGGRPGRIYKIGDYTEKPEFMDEGVWNLIKEHQPDPSTVQKMRQFEVEKMLNPFWDIWGKASKGDIEAQLIIDRTLEKYKTLEETGKLNRRAEEALAAKKGGEPPPFDKKEFYQIFDKLFPEEKPLEGLPEDFLFGQAEAGQAAREVLQGKLNTPDFVKVYEELHRRVQENIEGRQTVKALREYYNDYLKKKEELGETERIQKLSFKGDIYEWRQMLEEWVKDELSGSEFRKGLWDDVTLEFKAGEKAEPQIAAEPRPLGYEPPLDLGAPPEFIDLATGKKYGEQELLLNPLAPIGEESFIGPKNDWMRQEFYDAGRAQANLAPNIEINFKGIPKAPVPDERSLGGQLYDRWIKKTKLTKEEHAQLQSAHDTITENMPEVSDLLDKMPESERGRAMKSVMNAVAGYKWLKGEAADLIRLSFWDADTKTLNWKLSEIDGKANEVSAIMKQRTIELLGKKFKPSDEFVNTLFGITLDRTLPEVSEATYKTLPEGWVKRIESLSEAERKSLFGIFGITKGMKEIYLDRLSKAVNKNGKLLIDIMAAKEGITREAFLENVKASMPPNYFPLLRPEGNFVVYARAIGKGGKKGDMIFSTNYKDVADAQAAESYLKKNYPDAEVRSFDTRKEYGIEFSQLTSYVHDLPQLSKSLNKYIGVELPELGTVVKKGDIDLLNNLLQSEYTARWARGRFAKRHSIPGFSKDIPQVLQDYFDSFPKSMERRFASGEIAAEIEKIPSGKQQWARDTVDFWMGRKDRETALNHGIRNVMYAFALGLKPSFGLVNLTQRLMTTLAWAQAEAGATGVAAVGRAQLLEGKIIQDYVMNADRSQKWFPYMSDFIRKTDVLDPIQKEVMGKLFDRKQIDNLRTQELIGKGNFGKYLGVFANLSEKSNRMMTAFTAIELGRAKGFEGEALYKYTKDFIDSTQWQYSLQNRPELGRGWLSIPFMFKSYILNDIHFLKNLYGRDKGALTTALATRLLFGGALGIPGMQLIMGALDWGGRIVYEDYDLKKEELKNQFKDKYTERLFNTLALGVPSNIGINGSINWGAAEYFSAEPMLLQNVKAAWKSIQEAKEDVDTSGEGGVPWRALKSILPSEIKKAIPWDTRDVFGRERVDLEAIKRMPKEFEFRERAEDIWGKLPKDMPNSEKVLRFIGFSVNTEAEFSDAIWNVRKAAQEIRKEKEKYHRDIGRLYYKDKYEAAIQKEMEAYEKGYDLSPKAIAEQERRFRGREQ